MSSCYPSGRLRSTVLDKPDRSEVCRRQSLRWAPSAVEKYTAEVTLGVPTLCVCIAPMAGRQTGGTHTSAGTHTQRNKHTADITGVDAGDPENSALYD